MATDQQRAKWVERQKRRRAKLKASLEGVTENVTTQSVTDSVTESAATEVTEDEQPVERQLDVEDDVLESPDPSIAKKGFPRYTEEAIEKVLGAIRAGSTETFACSKGGISLDGWNKWKNRPKNQERFDEALGAWADFHLQNIDSHARKNWTASAWRLQRRFPHLYADPNMLIQIANVNSGGKSEDATHAWMELASNSAESQPQPLVEDGVGLTMDMPLPEIQEALEMPDAPCLPRGNSYPTTTQEPEPVEQEEVEESLKRIMSQPVRPLEATLRQRWVKAEPSGDDGSLRPLDW